MGVSQFVSVCMCGYKYASVHMRVFVPLCACFGIYRLVGIVCKSMCVSVFVGLSACVSMGVHCVDVSVCLCHLSIFNCVCISVCKCSRVSV